MKIESLTLTNFRCFGPEKTKIQFKEEVTAFVGGNGSGKTAVFQALSRLFGVSKSQRTIQVSDFHLAEMEEIKSGATLSIDIVLCFPELDGVDADAIEDAVPEYFLQMAASEPGGPLKVRIKLKATWIDDGTPEGTVQEELRWVHTISGKYKWDDCTTVQAIERGAIQLIYVPANRDASVQVSALLNGRLWQAARWSDKFRKSSAKSAKLIQKRFEREKPAKFVLKRLSHRWSQVYEGDTDTKPVLRLVEKRFAELVRRAAFAFHPDEAGQERELSSLSDGQRSLFHIALTAATLEIEKAVLSSPHDESLFDQEKIRRVCLTILAIEEPENCLSPFFLTRIILQAREIGSLASAQVLLSSHSAAILSRIDPQEVRYFRLDRKTRQSSIRKLTLPSEDSEANSYIRLAVKAYPELYFARYVILGEGETERIVIPRIADAMDVPLDLSFVPIVPLGGRYVQHFERLLTDLQIPHASLLDLDLGRKHGGIKLVSMSFDRLSSDLSDNPIVSDGDINLDDQDDLTDSDLLEGGFEGNGWLQALAYEGVYFAYPLDVDFSMLMAFPNEYRHPHFEGKGPKGDHKSIQEKKSVSLKTGGDPTLYDQSYDEHFKWYPYLFLSHSKPETHLAALSRITKKDLANNAPPELKALIERVKQFLSRDFGE